MGRRKKVEIPECDERDLAANMRSIKEMTKEMIDQLPLVDQLAFWQSQYERVMKAIQILFIADLGKIMVIDKSKLNSND